MHQTLNVHPQTIKAINASTSFIRLRPYTEVCGRLWCASLYTHCDDQRCALATAAVAAPESASCQPALETFIDYPLTGLRTRRCCCNGIENPKQFNPYWTVLKVEKEVPGRPNQPELPSLPFSPSLPSSTAGSRFPNWGGGNPPLPFPSVFPSPPLPLTLPPVRSRPFKCS